MKRYRELFLAVIKGVNGNNEKLDGKVSTCGLKLALCKIFYYQI